MWIAFAFLSAFFAGITSILAKCGIKKTDSNVATAIRTVVVLIFSWIMVFIVGSQDTISQIGLKALVFLILSGLATGASWLCYFHALQKGDINKVVPIDKSSTILTIILALIFLGEGITPLKGAAVVMIGAGTFVMIKKKKAGPEPEEKKEAAYLRRSFGFFRCGHVNSRENRNRRRGIQPRNGNTYLRCAYYGMDSGFRFRKTVGGFECSEKGTVLHMLIGTCNGRFLAMLLQGTQRRACKCGRSDR